MWGLRNVGIEKCGDWIGIKGNVLHSIETKVLCLGFEARTMGVAGQALYHLSYFAFVVLTLFGPYTYKGPYSIRSIHIQRVRFPFPFLTQSSGGSRLSFWLGLYLYAPGGDL
ncbi:hypothetical protein VNO77_02672 [Canavalia gladiata]|uniref:Uncharacterized protein n=1 Tax=Canavalia gladiata TaxID=3824 RepID=A0AAN9RBH4_CANGL